MRQEQQHQLRVGDLLNPILSYLAPPKKANRKGKRKNGGRRRNTKNNTQTRQSSMAYNPPARIGSTPFPPRFVTRMTCEADYKVAAAAASITNGYVYANTLYTPFYNVGGAAATLPYTHLGPATAATLQPFGATSLLNSNLYEIYKVNQSRIRVQLIPGPACANVEVTVAPSISTSQPSTIYIAKGAPYSRSMMFSSTGSSEGKSLVVQCAPGEFLGFSRLERAADIASLNQTFGSTPQTPVLAFVWSIFLQTADGNQFVAASLLRIRLEWDVELTARFAEMKTT